MKLFKTILNHLQIEAQQSDCKLIIYSQSQSKSMFILSLLAPKASVASMGAFYFRERVYGYCYYSACGY